MEPIIGEMSSKKTLIKDSDSAHFVRDVIEGSKERPVLVDFWAEWCGPCKELTPILEKLVREKDGAVALIKVDIERNQDIARQLGIQSVPTVYAFYEGRPLDAFQGVLPESKLRDFIDKIIENAGGGRNALDDMLDKATKALEADDIEAATEIFTAVLQVQPDHAAALSGLARIALSKDDIAGAEQSLEMIPKDKNEDPAVVKARAALELARQTKTAGDLDDLERALAADPKNPETRFALALAQAANGHDEEAAAHLLEIIRAERDWNESAARKQLIKMFEAAGPTAPFTLKWRRQLSSALFS